MVKKHKKKCSASPVMKEKYIKITIKHHFIPLNEYYNTINTPHPKKLELCVLWLGMLELL